MYFSNVKDIITTGYITMAFSSLFSSLDLGCASVKVENAGLCRIKGYSSSSWN